MEKLDGAFETARIHHALPDHVAEILNALVVEFLNTGNVFFVFLGEMKLDRQQASAIAWAGNVEKSVFRHPFSFPLFPRFPETASGPIACSAEVRLSAAFSFHRRTDPPSKSTVHAK